MSEDADLPTPAPEKRNYYVLSQRGITAGLVLTAFGIVAGIICFLAKAMPIFEELGNAGNGDPAVLSGRLLPVLDAANIYFNIAKAGFVILIVSALFRLTQAKSSPPAKTQTRD